MITNGQLGQLFNYVLNVVLFQANDSDADDADDNNKHENKEDIAKYSNSETSSTMQPVRDRSVDDGRCRQMHPLFSRCAARYEPN